MKNLSASNKDMPMAWKSSIDFGHDVLDDVEIVFPDVVLYLKVEILVLCIDTVDYHFVRLSRPIEVILCQHKHMLEVLVVSTYGDCLGTKG